ncbi:hypothetical protein [Methylobacillus flagellatus]|uniref:hypothetical protein n=1 Tax=Methylobacillus flagellatus TaxID=405 RepID=UPI0025701486|nr:hypothetical protein [Methylobacillus flagellatus]
MFYADRMCGGARYVDEAGRDWKIYFPNPKAALPVARASGQVEWVKWGRRKEEPGKFVQGGWARQESVNAGKWDRVEPELVQLAVTSFMEKDAARTSHWIDVPAGMAINALIATMEGESRLYVITTETPAEYVWVHDRWPLIKIITTD